MICKAFTFRRFYNLAISEAAYALSLLCRKPIVWGYPVSVMIEPTNFCNLQCPLCPSGAGLLTRERGYMDFGLYKKVIDSVCKDSCAILLWNQGEPFLHQDICQMIEYAHSKRMIVILSTNANVFPDPVQLVQSGLDQLIISADGASQETYNKYRVNGEIEKVIDNIKKIVASKVKASGKMSPYILCQFIVMKHNEHEIEYAKKIFGELKIDQFVLKTVQILSKEDIENFLPSNPKYRRYKTKGNVFELKYGVKNQCFRLWHRPVINWDGEMAVCCFDKDNQYKIGNIQNRSFMDLWKSNQFITFRKNVLRDRKIYEICRNCGEGISLRVK